MSNLTNLQFLDISHSRELNDDSLKIIGKLYNLKELDISECDSITDNGIKYLSTLSNLEKLNLNNCDGLIGKKNPVSFNSMQKLKIIDLQWCINLARIDISKLINLTNIYLDGCDQIIEIKLKSSLKDLLSTYNSYEKIYKWID